MYKIKLKCQIKFFQSHKYTDSGNNFPHQQATLNQAPLILQQLLLHWHHSIWFSTYGQLAYYGLCAHGCPYKNHNIVRYF